MLKSKHCCTYLNTCPAWTYSKHIIYIKLQYNLIYNPIRGRNEFTVN